MEGISLVLLAQIALPVLFLVVALFVLIRSAEVFVERRRHYVAADLSARHKFHYVAA